MPLIRLEDVSFAYSEGDAPVVRNLNLSLTPGERLAIIGSSGAGKSTVGRLMAGLLQPSRGTVTIQTGESTDHWEAPRPGHGVAIVFQNPEHQLIAETVEEDIAFGPENLGLETQEIRHRVDAALRSLRIEHLRFRNVQSLSGGEKQKVAVAGALAMEPKCVIFDESTSMLHPKAKEEFEEAVTTPLARSGVAVVQITHDMDEACRAHRIALLNNGRLEALEPPESIFADWERLDACGLEPPDAAALASVLIRRGIHLDPMPLTEMDLLDALDRAVFR